MIRIGDKFWVNKLVVKNASDTIFTIGVVKIVCCSR
jgi:hypothetical protein